MVHIHNTKIQDRDVGGKTQLPGHPGIHTEFQARQNYIMRHHLKNSEYTNKNTK